MPDSGSYMLQAVVDPAGPSLLSHGAQHLPQAALLELPPRKPSARSTVCQASLAACSSFLILCECEIIRLTTLKSKHGCRLMAAMNRWPPDYATTACGIRCAPGKPMSYLSCARIKEFAHYIYF